MADVNTYYYKFGEVEEAEIEGVVNDICNVGIDQIDTCIVNMVVDDRAGWKKALKNKLFKKIRRSDSYVEFRGWITEVRFVDNDQYNMTFKVKSKVKVLNELLSHVSSEWLDSPGTITAKDATTITNDEDITEPPAYVSASTAVLIVPHEDPVYTDDDVEDSLVFSADAVVVSGTYADLNDDDDSTGINFYKLNTQELFVEIKGSSTNAKANVVGAKVEFITHVKIGSVYDVTCKLEYWDGDSWEQIAETYPAESQNLASALNVWDHNISFGKGEYISGNDFLDESDDFRFRLIFTTSGNVRITAKPVRVKIRIFTDAKYTGPYFPITAYTTATKVTVNVNPVDAGVDVGNTFTIGWTDLITLGEIFDEYPAKSIPFTVDIDTNFVGYTARSFYEIDLMQCLEYFLDKQRAHYYYDHNADTLYIRKESTMITDGTLRTITESDIETFNLDDKEEEHLRSVTVVGATYRRGDGDEIDVSYTYPDDEFLGAGLGYTGTARKEIVVNKAEITSWTEAKELAKSLYVQSYDPRIGIGITLAAYNDTYVVGNKLTVTDGLDGITVSAEPIIEVNTTYDVANDLAIKQVQIGWQRTPLLKRHSNLLNELSGRVKDLQRYSRGISSQDKHKLMRADGVITGADLTLTSPTVTLIKLADNMLVSSGNFNIAVPDFANDTLVSKTSTDVLTNKTLTTPTIQTNFVLDAGDNPTTISKTAGEDKLSVSGAFSCTQGLFGANSVQIGDTGTADYTMSLEDQGGGVWWLNLTVDNANDCYFILENINAGVSPLHLYVKDGAIIDSQYIILDFVGNGGAALRLTSDNAHTFTLGGSAGGDHDWIVIQHPNIVSFPGSVGIGVSTPTAIFEVAGSNDVDLTDSVCNILSGSPTGQHLEFDDNEIMSKLDATTAGTLFLQNEGGAVWIGATTSLRVNTITATADTDHKIELDPAADTIHIHPGDVAGDNYFVLYSGDATQNNPQFLPNVTAEGRIGNATTYWYAVYASYLRYKNVPAVFDHYDDLLLLDNVGADTKGKLTNIDFMRDEEGFFNAGDISGFTLGCVKQLHQKVKDQQTTIEQLAVEIGQLRGE